MTTLPEGLPPWANAIAAVMVLIGFGVTHWFSVMRLRRTPTEPVAALVQGDIMSTEPMKRLAEATERLDKNVARMTEAINLDREAKERHTAALDRACLTLERLGGRAERLDDALRDVRDEMRSK